MREEPSERYPVPAFVAKDGWRPEPLTDLRHGGEHGDAVFHVGGQPDGLA
jgi:hypothetical protein